MAGMSRAPRRADVYALLLEQILEAALPPGGRVVESRLAEELGVSRTPLREALFRLEREGFVRHDLARGFSVQPLSEQEVEEVYPMLWTLEGLALRSSGALVASVLPELERHNQALAQAAQDQARRLDALWHRTLLSRCPNQRLLGTLEGLRRTVQRYERLYMQDPSLIALSVGQHREVAGALRQGDVDKAVDKLAANWRFGMEAVLLKLRQGI